MFHLQPLVVLGFLHIVLALLVLIVNSQPDDDITIFFSWLDEHGADTTSIAWPVSSSQTHEEKWRN
jgi:hypothetical protein